jgi:hypothetical protein
MEPALAPHRQCARCGDNNDLYLLTLQSTTAVPPGGAIICCGACRGFFEADVAVPLVLVTPRLLLGLQRLRKLNANLGQILAAVDGT